MGSHTGMCHLDIRLIVCYTVRDRSHGHAFPVSCKLVSYIACAHDRVPYSHGRVSWPYGRVPSVLKIDNELQG